MRIEFLTQADPLHIPPFFEEFFTCFLKRFQILQVTCCRAMGRRSRWELAASLASLYGPGGAARLAWQLAQLGAADLPDLCWRYGVPYQKLETPNHPGYQAAMEERQPDILVSVACPYILRPPLLEVPRLGCLNVHHAPLPRYRGMMPTFWQLYHGERRLGLTIHWMDARVDEGRILRQEYLPVEEGDTLEGLIRRSKRHAAHCLASVLQDLTANGWRAGLPPQGPASTFTFPTREEIREFHRRGCRAI